MVSGVEVLAEDGEGPHTESGSGASLPEAQLGPRLREARLERSLSFEQLAERTGLSRTYLRNLERGVNSPTIATLRRIVDALGITFIELLGALQPPRRAIVRRDDRPDLGSEQGGGVRFELLTPPQSAKLEALMVHLAPGAASSVERVGHPGEEMGIVISGRLRCTFGDEVIELLRGDSVTWDASVPHRMENPGPEPSASLWCLTPPGR